MAKIASTTAPTEEKPKQKRTILSAAERIAKARAEVAALEAKEQDKAKAKLAANADALVKATAAVKKAEDKVESLTAERSELQKLAGIEVAEATDESA